MVWRHLAILACGVIGSLNGIIHVGLRIPSFMVTLGMWFIGVGVATLLLGGSTVRVLDKGIRSLALERPLGIFPDCRLGRSWPRLESPG